MRHFLRAFSLPLLLIVVALLVAGCASDQRVSPSNPGGAEPGPVADVTSTVRPTAVPENPSADPAPTATPMDDDIVTIDLTTPAPPNQQPLPAGQARIYGRILDPQGAPVGGAAVTIPRGTSSVPERAALTDENGNYNWVVLPGVYTVQVNAAGFKVAQAEADTQQQPEFELDFTLEPE